MSDSDPYHTKIWHSYRRETAGMLAVWSLLMMMFFGYPVYGFIVENEEPIGGVPTVAVLIGGILILLTACGAAIATMRASARESKRPMWWTAGLVTAGTVMPVLWVYLVSLR